MKQNTAIGFPHRSPARPLTCAFIGAGLLFVGVGVFAQALSAQSTQSDSIVQLTAEAQGLSPVAPQDLPMVGTFWVVTPEAGGLTPWPCPPPDASLPIYSITSDAFLVDASGGMVSTNALDGEAISVEMALTNLAATVVQVIERVQGAETAAALRTMGMMSAEDLAPPGDGDTNSYDVYTNSFVPFSLDTNVLWLEVTNVDIYGGTACVNLHMATNLVYAIWSSTNLSIPLSNWQVETEVWPSDTNCQPFTFPTQGRDNVFLRAEDWSTKDSDSDGIPDWWAWMYWGMMNITDTNLDYSGNNHSFGYEFSNSIAPTVFSFIGIEVTNNYVNNPNVPVQLDVVGSPYYIATLVDNASFSNAVWNAYSSSTVLVNLGLTEGWHDVWVGLRGHGDEPTSAVWQWKRLKLDYTAPVLTITNPTNNTMGVPLIQLQGFSPEELDTISCEVSNALGVVTNLDAGTTHRDYDNTTGEFSTNYFECLDIPLTNGLNIITLCAGDLAGNGATLSYSLTVDYSAKTNPPDVQIVWPQEGGEISGSHLTIRGQVADPTVMVSATITDTNGNTNVITGLVEREGRFWLDDLPLDSGTNSVSITVRDIVGNQTTTNFNVIQSDLALTMDPISDDSQLWQPTIGVSGTVGDSSAVVTVNGVAAVVEANVNGAGTYNWSANAVPNTAGGVAVFQLQAEVSGQSPAQSAVDWDKPSRLYLKNYTASDYGMGHAEFGGNSWVWTYDWDGSDTCNWSDGQGGSSSEWAEDRYENIDGQGGWSHEYRVEQTTNPPSQWPAIAPGRFHFYEYVEGAWVGQPPYAGTNDESTSGDWYPALPGEHCRVQMSAGQTWIGDGYLWYPVVSNNHGTYWRTADATMVLETGGRAVSQHKNLFCLSGSAGEVQDKFAHPAGGTGNNVGWIWDQTESFSAPIPMSDVKIDGESLGSDGRLWRAYEDNVTRDVTPRVKNKDFYVFDLSQQKYKLHIMANDYPLAEDKVRPGAKHAIGEKINLSPIFSPALPGETQKSPVQWTLDGTYINAFKVWLFDHEGTGVSPHDHDEDLYDSAQGLTDFRIDSSRLQQENAFAWWQTGSTTDFETENISVGMGLTFANGQYVVITAKGQIGMHQPSVSWRDLGYHAGVVAGKQLIGYGASGLYEVGLLDDAAGSGIYETADSQSLTPGQFGITQLVKRNASDPLNSWSDWELDRSMPYDVGDHDAFAAYDVSGHAAASLGDAPHMDGIGGAWSQDQFVDYFMYRANTTGSIWATLGTVNWNWFGSIVWCTSCTNGWVWTDTPQFYCSQSIAPSHQHPEFKATH